MLNPTLSPPECLCIKLGSGESQFNDSLTVKGKVTKTVHKPLRFEERR